MKRRKRRESLRGGFTLIEVLLVLVILVILGSMAGVFIMGRQKQALINSAKSQIGLFGTAIKTYGLDMRGYPATAHGLIVLREPPGDGQTASRWTGPYLEKDVPLDPWDNEYQYELVDDNNYRIWSFGPDGAEGTADDISSD